MAEAPFYILTLQYSCILIILLIWMTEAMICLLMEKTLSDNSNSVFSLF